MLAWNRCHLLLISLLYQRQQQCTLAERGRFYVFPQDVVRQVVVTVLPRVRHSPLPSILATQDPTGRNSGPAISSPGSATTFSCRVYTGES